MRSLLSYAGSRELLSIRPKQSRLQGRTMVLLGAHQQHLTSPGALALVEWHALQKCSKRKCVLLDLMCRNVQREYLDAERFSPRSASMQAVALHGPAVVRCQTPLLPFSDV